MEDLESLENLLNFRDHFGDTSDYTVGEREE